MYKCEICGREIFKKCSLYGYKCLCNKHMHQLLKYGKFLDKNPRTVKDFNKIIINGDVAEIELYNSQTSDIIGYCIIDSEDINKVQYHKWRISHGHVISGCKNKQRDIGHLILSNENKNLVIDHINGNPYDNRKCNLRLCEQKKNTLNKHFMSLNTSGVIGVTRDKRKGRTNQWVAEIRYENIKIFIGAYLTIEEAAFARYCGECILFKEYRNTNNDEEKFEMFKTIPTIRKNEIETYVTNKIHKKFGSV